jgi:hypothetical protein
MAIVTKGELPLNNNTKPPIATAKPIVVILFMASILRLFGRETNALHV